jgi:threonine dehydrogenase-like Zn-dependent dehydrogenase
MFSHCEDGVWILGSRIAGTQAEYLRIPQEALWRDGDEQQL